MMRNYNLALPYEFNGEIAHDSLSLSLSYSLPAIALAYFVFLFPIPPPPSFPAARFK